MEPVVIVERDGCSLSVLELELGGHVLRNDECIDFANSLDEDP